MDERQNIIERKEGRKGRFGIEFGNGLCDQLTANANQSTCKPLIGYIYCGREREGERKHLETIIEVQPSECFWVETLSCAVVIDHFN